MFITIRCIDEAQPGEKWKERFERIWPIYRQWFLSEGAGERPGYQSSFKALKKYIPELLPVYQQLCELAGGGDLESRFLSQYCPPPYMAGCSQVAWVKDGPALIRNYDYGIESFEGCVWKTEWLKPVIGISDSSWGLLDGINSDGLVASLTFGGRKVVGHGLGIPLIIRYILETCKTVGEGIAVLQRIPVHMSYNVTLIDKTGQFNTIYLSPDRPADITPWAVGTNHQHQVEWPDYARISATVERKEYLDACWLNPMETRDSLIRRFLEPPLFSKNYKKRFGTLYTAVYDNLKNQLDLHWKSFQLSQSFDNFVEMKENVMLAEPVRHKLTH